jgi:L-aminopeptidase/D-esterase-like protein
MDDGTMVEAAGLIYGSAPGKAEIRKLAPAYNTTLAVIATDAVISKEQANRLATIAHDGFARVIRPVHTQMDGDVIFTLSTGRLDVDANFITLCAAAAEVTARAVYNGVLAGNIS